jgi:hypothetical protein
MEEASVGGRCEGGRQWWPSGVSGQCVGDGGGTSGRCGGGGRPKTGGGSHCGGGQREQVSKPKKADGSSDVQVGTEKGRRLVTTCGHGGQWAGVGVWSNLSERVLVGTRT